MADKFKKCVHCKKKIKEKERKCSLCSKEACPKCISVCDVCKGSMCKKCTKDHECNPPQILSDEDSDK